MKNLDQPIDKKEFQHTYLETRPGSFKSNYGDVIRQVHHLLTDWSYSRQALEDDWEESWAQYLSNSRASTQIERKTVLTVGDVESNYRHKIPTSKAFEIVETTNSYLQDAFFPTKNWFSLVPKKPMENWEEDTEILNKYMLCKLEESNFQDYWDTFVRQLCIIGTSVLALPWDYRYKDTFRNELTKSGEVKRVPYSKTTRNGFGFEVVDMYDFYFDPLATQPREGSVIRRLVRTRGQVVRMIESGEFPLGDLEEAYRMPGYSRTTEATLRQETQKWMNGIQGYQENDQIELFEFWGDLVVGGCEFQDVHVITGHDNLFVFEPNPYWSGTPFVTGTLVNGHNTPYGMSLLSVNLGNLHQLYINQNQRLDANEIVLNPMFLFKSDGSVQANDIYSEPGRVIPCEDPETDVVQLAMNVQNLNASLQDESILEDRINRASGVGDYVGVNSGRDAERVTAREVDARQSAGGNRLGRYHKHLESTSLRELLVKSYGFLQQFITEDETVRVQKPNTDSISDQFDYYKVGQQELQNEMDVIPIGADHVIDKEFELRQRIDFYTFVQGNPQLSQFINWKEVVKDLARRLIKDDWAKYIVLPEDQGSPGVDAATGKSPIDMMEQLGAGQGGPPGMPPEMGLPPEMGMPPDMLQGQPPPPSFDNAQIQALMQQNPQVANQIIEGNLPR